MAVDDRRRLHRGAVQVSTWRDDHRTVVLTPNADRPTPSAVEVEALIVQLSADGHERAITSALHVNELEPFLANGFNVHERLHLLRHTLERLPPVPPVPVRRAWRRDRPAVLALDASAFDTFWTLDARGLDDAVRATPVNRFRVTRDEERSHLTGYAVTGRAGGRGYLQRLAVRPDHLRRGIGTALVVDALEWLRRGGATLALVNTQEQNEAALALYLACGFAMEPAGLAVLARTLEPSTAP